MGFPNAHRDLSSLIPLVEPAARLWVDGRVTRVVGISAEAYVNGAAVGDLCHIETPGGSIPAEVAGFAGERVLLMPLGELRGVGAGARVIRRGATGRVPVGDALVGRIVDGFGRPLDGRPLTPPTESRDLYAPPLLPMERRPVDKPLYLGIRALDAMLTCGQGQRLGILAGPGVGKTVLLSMIAKRAACDVMVLALVGERGREVGDFVRSFQKSEAFNRTVVVAATSDRPPLERLRASLLATSVAEYFRDKGRNVLLVMDSLTRVAMAQREVGLAIGEPPTTKGYTPSVFAKLPLLLERAGSKVNSGSVTGIYTVLMEGDDLTDPVADASMAILDGQIVLSRQLAGIGHFPAIDLLRSVSRVMPEVVTKTHTAVAQRIRSMVAVIAENEDLVNIGAYVSGKNPRLDEALARKERIMEFLRQGIDEFTPPEETLRWLTQLASPHGGGVAGGVR
ncbi:MAG: FliI/YscN family ATPase [Pseudomonadota bacterium]